MVEYATLTQKLPIDSGGRRFSGPNGKMFAGTTSPDNDNEAIVHILLVDSNNNPLITGSSLAISGPDASGAAITASNPIIIGGKGVAAVPAQIVSGRPVNAYFDLRGILGVTVRGEANGLQTFPGVTTPTDGLPLVDSTRIMALPILYDGTNTALQRGDSTNGAYTNVRKLPSTGINGPASTNDVGNEAATDEAIAGAATGLRYMGFSCRESTESARAVFNIRRGTSNAGAVMDTVTLEPGESAREWYGPDGIEAAAGIWLERVSGTCVVIGKYKVV